MGKIVLKFITRVLIMTLVYTCIMWGFKAAFDHDYAVSLDMLIQGAIFSLLYIPISLWDQRRKKK